MHRGRSFEKKLVGVFVAWVGVLAQSVSPLQAGVTSEGYRVVGYYGGWAQHRPQGCRCMPADLDGFLITHMIYAFAKVVYTEEGHFQVVPVESHDSTPVEGMYAHVEAFKRRYAHVRTLYSIGGWAESQSSAGQWVFHAMVQTSATRHRLIQSAIQHARTYGFDGIDIDWEYPQAEDSKNLTMLLTEFRSAIDAEAMSKHRPPLILTFAAAAVEFHFKNLELAKIHPALDWIHVMTYDFHTGVDQRTGMLAPLYADTHWDSPFYADYAIKSFLAAGVPADKIVLGIPFHVRAYQGVKNPDPGSSTSGLAPADTCTSTPGYWALYDMQSKLHKGQYRGHWDPITSTPYAYNAQTQVWASYENQQSIQEKLNYIRTKNLGGAMVWALDLDTYASPYPFLRLIYEGLQPTNPSPNSRTQRPSVGRAL